MSKVTNYAILVCFSVYLFMGVFGYFHYGNGTKGNVLQNCFPTEDPMVVLSFGTCRCITCRCCWVDVPCHVYLCSQEPNDSLVSMLFYFSIFLKRPLPWPLSWLFPWSSFLVGIRWTWCWNICLKATAVATTVVVRLVKSYLEATTPKNWILASLGTTPTTSTKQMSMCTQLLRNVVTWHWRHSSAPRRWPLHCLCQKFKSCFNWWVVREFVETGVCKRALTYGLFYFLSIQYQSFFVAGTTSAFVCFILPAAFVLKLQQTKRLQLTTCEWWLSWCLASGGCVVGVLSTYVTLYNLIDSGRHN